MTKEEILQSVKNKVKYEISMEIEGDFAMWSRNDTGSEKTTYPFPTFSALKGIFESILYMPSVCVLPYKLQICSPIKFQSFSFNYWGEKRKPDLINKNNACQISNTILYKPCYRCYAVVVNNNNFVQIPNKYRSINHAHSYQSQFKRRLKRHQSQHYPCLGMSEFLATYFGPFRETTSIEDSINFTVPSMILCCYDSLNNGKYDASYVQNVDVVNGEVNYLDIEQESVLVRQ